MPSSAPVRDPPSFPTRRSSDLRRRGPRRRGPWWRCCCPLPRPRPRLLRPRRRHRGRPTGRCPSARRPGSPGGRARARRAGGGPRRSEEHTSELQSRENLVCRLLRPCAIHPLSLHDALPISAGEGRDDEGLGGDAAARSRGHGRGSSARAAATEDARQDGALQPGARDHREDERERGALAADLGDRKSTRLNSSHVKISYAVFCARARSTLFPYTTLFRSPPARAATTRALVAMLLPAPAATAAAPPPAPPPPRTPDRTVPFSPAPGITGRTSASAARWRRTSEIGRAHV